SISISTKGVNIPSGLNNGQQIEKNLGYYLWPVADIADFSTVCVQCNGYNNIQEYGTEKRIPVRRNKGKFYGPTVATRPLPPKKDGR
ncbi:MAG: hypothetical protein LBV26_08965, partial [Bacteroidales bacterium]|nr:hypothetical protein [Bacteroidales bacterium]